MLTEQHIDAYMADNRARKRDPRFSKGPMQRALQKKAIPPIASANWV